MGAPPGTCTRCHGVSLVEVLIAVAVATMVMLGLSGVISGAMQARDQAVAASDLTRQASFAMDRMIAATSRTRRLLLPAADNPITARNDAVRNLLAVTLGPLVDRDADGWPDADNDRDGRIDEDPGDDAGKDGCSGICGIDDDGDGFTDEDDVEDDDEDDDKDEDPVNGVDDDGDGSVDEDASKDTNNDGKPGVKDVDDDGDILVDEGNSADDDEDGRLDEDWWDPVVFYLQGTRLVERNPVPWDTNSDLLVDGRDRVEQTLADGVTQFRVERLTTGAGRFVLVEITLELTAGNGEKTSLVRRVRVAGAP